MSDTKNRKKIPTTLLFGAASIALLLASSSAPVHAKALAKVNGVEITDEDLKLAMDDLGVNHLYLYRECPSGLEAPPD